MASELIREDDEVVYGDSGYLGIEKREEIAQNEHLSSVDYRINLRPGRFPKVSDNAIDWTRQIEKRKSSVRSKAEHIFRIIKCQFGYRKVRYRGLKKKQPSEQRITPLYARLSRDDEKDGISGSIQHQRAILEKYAGDNRLPNPEFFFDDGYSGVTFVEVR